MIASGETTKPGSDESDLIGYNGVERPRPNSNPTPHYVLSTRRQLELMRDLQRLANERQLAEERIAREYRQAVTTAEEEHRHATTTADATRRKAEQTKQESYATWSSQIDVSYETERSGTQQEYRHLREETETKYKTTVATADEERKQAIWQAMAVFDTAKNNPREALGEVQQELANRGRHLDQLHADVREILSARRLWSREIEGVTHLPPTQPVDPPSTLDAARRAVADGTESARQHVAAMQDRRMSQLFEGFTPFVAAAMVWLALLLALGLTAGWGNWPLWLGGSLVAAVVLCGIGGWVLRRQLQAWALKSVEQFAAEAASARGAIELAATVARDKSRRDAQSLIHNRDEEIAEAEQRARTTIDEIAGWKQQTLAEANAKYPAQLAQLRQQHQTQIEEAAARHRETLTVLEGTHAQAAKQANQARRDALEAATARRDRQRSDMREQWFEGLGAIEQALAAMRERCDRLFPNWNHTSYETWSKPNEPVEAIQFGTATLDLAKVRHAVSSDPDLRPATTEIELPTLVTLHEQPSLVVSAEGAGRGVATDLLETLMVRYLTAMPPGKVRLTICDPVGLGENFASFMHLADHDETLINGRIWSESRDIDEQLTRLTAHMETILQKYLRNEYASIHEYNAQAGEVAEPFQVLTIANFPHGFSDTAARRLVSLVSGGPRCGIYVLMSCDRKQRLPNDFAMDDLIAPSIHLDWSAESERFAWRYPAMEHLPLALAERIERDALVPLVKQAGKAAKESIRVEVPFHVVIPEGERLWTETCDRELAIPIGRAGANRLHYVRLGKGTAQHLLVAGKTGSGKSTFLHALVTSGAMHYSPDELRFYLVDFKKGVEFKSYATHHLPHAEVVAIESEREFGLSVLGRLDEELSRRGEKFRAAGVQSLADYRADHPAEPMPRLLLVIDEFQELFVEDDKLAQSAGLLMDRLVRQGRAFGIHVLLGTQTLSGAYSLARSTLGQIAVRVALQCSEADAHLILSDERNQAARFLSRPGEAIYNDQNGLVSANQPFQVVWLPDRERAARLAEIRELAQQRELPLSEPIVFEGNAPADPLTNSKLVSLLAGQAATDAATGEAWLGAAVAIKPPTSVLFAPHGGSNLLVVGQQPSAALGVLTTAAISLAATEPNASLMVLDGSRADDDGQGVWRQVADALGERAEIVEQRDVPAALTRLVQELAGRDSQGDGSAPPIYLIVHNASRFRDLRKSEDDFSFSMDRDKPIAPDKQLADILKNGPQWNIHALVWCDGYNAVTRLFDRLALREFEMRVVFQMSAADSSNLLDTPAASKLAPHRALLYNDETGEAEKFRPYGPPTGEWLAEVAAALAPDAAVDPS